MYQSTQQVLEDLKSQGEVLEITEEVDANLEMAAIHRQVYAQQGPALWFRNIKGSRYSAVSNLYGTKKRWQYLFRQSLEQTKLAVHLKADPKDFFLRHAWKHPFEAMKLPVTGLCSLPKKVSARKAPVMAHEIQISDLPQIKSWPLDGGAFVTLPQVMSLPPNTASPMQCNVGMYRVQLSGNDYVQDSEIGLHYQIHRGIGIHHQEALRAGHSLKVTIAVGGPPAHSVAAVMPMPEGMSELIFAGMLANRRFRYVLDDGWIVSADADYCILGEIHGDEQKPEGPFGDHLGYYSLTHDFPLIKVKKVYARENAIWPFTVVGRPPQEDTSFGELIHDITKPMVSKELPGVKALHAVDAAGVHPLLFAQGSERYTPYRKTERPQELLTQASAVLGFNQCSLAKYLWIGDEQNNVDIENCEAFIQDCLVRLDFSRDLHFHTKTTMDTLDYSGEGLNCGSKLIIASSGTVKRELSSEKPEWDLGEEFSEITVVSAGILAVKSPDFVNYNSAQGHVDELCKKLAMYQEKLESYPLIILTEDPCFLSRNFCNFLWVAFTRSNPSHDVYGFQAKMSFKHWECQAPLMIDARVKPHHAPLLIEDANVLDGIQKKFPQLFSKMTC
ncbi:MAG: UbiD family decarboxylase [Oligoflexales bacterium]